MVSQLTQDMSKASECIDSNVTILTGMITERDIDTNEMPQQAVIPIYHNTPDRADAVREGLTTPIVSEYFLAEHGTFGKRARQNNHSQYQRSMRPTG